MKALTAALSKLPKSDHHTGNDRDHDVGIEQLRQQSNGHFLIRMLLEHAPDLPYRPTRHEVLKWARSIRRLNADLYDIRQQRRSQQTPRKIGFKRNA
jgi:hypothetical protein